MRVSGNYPTSGGPALAPGVYFQEVEPDRAAPFRTGVPVFVGYVEPGAASVAATIDPCGGMPPNCRCLPLSSLPRNCRAVLITAWDDFAPCVGQAVPNGFLDYAVRGFFENGGGRCVVVFLWQVGHGYEQTRALKELFRDKGPLEDLDAVDLVCVPDIMGEEIRTSPDRVLELQQDVLEYCRRMGDRFAIFDSAPVHGSGGRELKPAVGDDRRELLRQALEGPGRLPHRGRPVEGAVYFPWIWVKPLPRHKDKTVVRVPPCGHVAGIYARSDAAFGVHKAPANEIVEGAMDLEIYLSEQDQAELNEVGVNCLRSFPGRGIRVWGARTLSGQPNWKYVNVRRLFLTLVRWLESHMDDLVFEPNEPDLWNRVRDRIGAYCYELLQRGALKGGRPADAFFVKCDAETNPLEVREAGALICEVGLAPVVPAEFVVVRVTRSAAGTTAAILTAS
jgi:hypothetical protein